VTDTLLIQSGVFVGQRDDHVPPFEWFGTEPVIRFAPLTLQLVQSQIITSVQGLLGTGDDVTFVVQGSGLAFSGVVRQLKQIEAHPVGQVNTSIGGYRDVPLNRGELVRVSLQMLGDPVPIEDVGIIQVGNTVEGGPGAWRTEILFRPVDAIFTAGTTEVLAASTGPFNPESVPDGNGNGNGNGAEAP